jgi:hypothetical protein
MARIQTYALDGTIHDEDKVIGSDGVAGTGNGATKNYTVGELKTYINEGVNFLGWARYDGAQSFANDTEIAVSDGSYVNPAATLVTNQLIDPFLSGESNDFIFTEDDLHATYMLTVVFKASASNTNNTHVDLNFISGAADYDRLSKSIKFYKGNNTVQNFHEVFQFYVDSDLIDYGLQPRIYADGGSILVGDVIYFIQKTQTM